MEIRFKLNPKNEKDQVIIKVLQGEYSPSETIKNILYKMGTNGVEGQQVSCVGENNSVNISTGRETCPICDNEGNWENETSDDDKGKSTDKEIVNDNDIICYF